MKIKITFEEHERRDAVTAIGALMWFLPGLKLRKSDRYAPFFTFICTVGSHASRPAKRKRVDTHPPHLL